MVESAPSAPTLLRWVRPWCAWKDPETLLAFIVHHLFCLFVDWQHERDKCALLARRKLGHQLQIARKLALIVAIKLKDRRLGFNVDKTWSKQHQAPGVLRLGPCPIETSRGLHNRLQYVSDRKVDDNQLLFLVGDLLQREKRVEARLLECHLIGWQETLGR